MNVSALFGNGHNRHRLLHDLY